jgi:hypothetical protein
MRRFCPSLLEYLAKSLACDFSSGSFPITNESTFESIVRLPRHLVLDKYMSAGSECVFVVRICGRDLIEFADFFGRCVLPAYRPAQKFVGRICFCPPAEGKNA